MKVKRPVHVPAAKPVPTACSPWVLRASFATFGARAVSWAPIASPALDSGGANWAVSSA
ncbi:unnamed protein product [Cladocopium goreaui]|uniref:Uncharacterized protein n=1 Tax=Cladocopium goreaui TaxID=2562237 RepID=A0A9P1G0F4_9DINO|nr:unnamed protein product [Cladocopium goreaui]